MHLNSAAHRSKSLSVLQQTVERKSTVLFRMSNYCHLLALMSRCVHMLRRQTKLMSDQLP